ncbi:MAG TPA: heavy metal sensor histidine kinase [Bryobacteraceae bacterium]|nr:heavy metal sensor histidine kinase [Bryobacteraceae bacterium]
MKTRSIRFRLTLWYSAILAACLSIFAATVWVSTRRSIEHAVDESLRERLAGVSHFLSEQLRNGGDEDVERELEEHSNLTSGRDLLAVFDSRGNPIYRSDAMREINLQPANSEALSAGLEFRTVAVSRARFRFLTVRLPLEGKVYSITIARSLADFDTMFQRFQWIVLSLIPLVLILATAGGFWMSRRALRPVDEITQAARTIGIQNLSRRLSVPKTGDELERLTETLNDMMQRLDLAVKRITQFTADASHELRTPIAVMRTTAEVALRRDRPAGEYREALGQVLIELERTSSLVENLMMLARADSGVEALLHRPMDLTQSVREACLQGRTLAEARDIRFEVAVPTNPVVIDGDAQALRRAFLILIDNAVKYTPPGGRVGVSLSTTDGIAAGEVRDSGIGVSPEDLPNIFERFYRADKARSREMGGAGLGLSIARWIVQNHRGEILVESRPGQGSVFRLTLPVTKS